MRNLFRRMGARTGISLGLILVIAVVLIVFRLLDGSGTRNPGYREPVMTPTIAGTVGDDGILASATGEATDDSVVLATAASFADAWLQRTLPSPQWLDGLRPYATTDLIDRLAGVDPLDVPTEATAGAPAIRSRSDLYAIVIVPIGRGDALALDLVVSDGQWLVATLDREVG